MCYSRVVVFVGRHSLEIAFCSSRDAFRNAGENQMSKLRLATGFGVIRTMIPVGMRQRVIQLRCGKSTMGVSNA